MRVACLALMVSVMVPAAARAEPIPISVSSGLNGFSMTGANLGSTIDLGTIVMPNVNAIGDIMLSGFRNNTDIVVSFVLEGIGAFDTLRLELFNPWGANNWDDPAQPAGSTRGLQHLEQQRCAELRAGFRARPQRGLRGWVGHCLCR